MPRIKPIVARTPEALAEALGLSAADAKEWQVQYELLKRLKGIVQREKITHAEIAKRAGTSRTRVTGNPERQSRKCLERSADSGPRRVGIPGEGIGVASWDRCLIDASLLERTAAIPRKPLIRWDGLYLLSTGNVTRGLFTPLGCAYKLGQWGRTGFGRRRALMEHPVTPGDSGSMPQGGKEFIDESDIGSDRHCGSLPGNMRVAVSGVFAVARGPFTYPGGCH